MGSKVGFFIGFYLFYIVWFSLLDDKFDNGFLERQFLSILFICYSRSAFRGCSTTIKICESDWSIMECNSCNSMGQLLSIIQCVLWFYHKMQLLIE